MKSTLEIINAIADKVLAYKPKKRKQKKRKRASRSGCARLPAKKRTRGAA
jgi:hypothetical protein